MNRPVSFGKIKRACLVLHLFVGLVVGPVFVLMGLTGSALVFHRTLDEWFLPDRLPMESSRGIRSLDEVLTAARMVLPHERKATFFFMPRVPGGAYHVFSQVVDDATGAVHIIDVAVDPANADVLSSRIWGRSLFSFIYEFHESFLLDAAGDWFVGGAGIILIGTVTTGLCLWWQSGAWRMSFTSDLNLHKSIGILSAAGLLIVALSGLYLAFPKGVRIVVDAFVPVHVSVREPLIHLRSTRKADSRTLSLQEAVEVADQRFPNAVLKVIQIPETPDGVFRVAKRQSGEPIHTFGYSQVWIDQYSGKVLAERDWRMFGTGDVILAWLFPLHNGEALGQGGRVVVFIVGLMPLVLYTTAFRSWWKKRRLRRDSGEGGNVTDAP